MLSGWRQKSDVVPETSVHTVSIMDAFVINATLISATHGTNETRKEGLSQKDHLQLMKPALRERYDFQVGNVPFFC